MDTPVQDWHIYIKQLFCMCKTKPKLNKKNFVYI